MLGFGLSWSEEWGLTHDGRAVHRFWGAAAMKGDDGRHGFAHGEEGWQEEVMPLEEAPRHVRDELLRRVGLQRDPRMPTIEP